MDRQALQAKVRQCVDFLEDEEYWTEILTSCDAQHLVTALDPLLRSTDRGIIDDTCLFIRDLLLVAPRVGCWWQFNNLYYDSILVSSLVGLVTSEFMDLRRPAVYTLGKTIARRTIPRLHSACVRFRESDPLLLPDLLFEIGWLSRDNALVNQLLRDMSESSFFLTRWATLGDPGAFAADSDLAKEVLGRLREDKVSAVREEAAFLFKELEFERSLPSIPTKSQKRRLRAELEKERPEITWDSLCVGFWRYMYEWNLRNYEVREVEDYFNRRLSKNG